MSPRIRSGRALVVGFAAETDHVERYARGKLEKKRLDLIAANRVGVAGSGFESDDNALIVYGRRRLGARARPGARRRNWRRLARPDRANA